MIEVDEGDGNYRFQPDDLKDMDYRYKYIFLYESSIDLRITY